MSIIPLIAGFVNEKIRIKTLFFDRKKTNGFCRGKTIDNAHIASLE